MKTNQNILGIVAEYNPLHNGHIYQMKACKKQCNAECVVAVMSGNFTQRGEPALIDKWSRAKMAIAAGVDLVVELPFYFACNSAEYFAKGAVDILNDMGIVTHIGFGSESGNIDELYQVSKKLAYESDELQASIKKHLDEGCSFPKARALALGYGDELIGNPNNILAIEYIKWLIKNKSLIKPVTIARYKVGYRDEKIDVVSNIGSGSGIRKSLKEGNLNDDMLAVPKSTADIIKENRDHLVFKNNEKYFDLLRSKILTSSKEELKQIFAASEGLENKLKREIRYAKDFDEFIERISSKRYTKTRLQRLCTQTLIGLKKDTEIPRYIRVLGFNDKGAKLIKTMKKSDKCTMAIITNINKEKVQGVDIDIIASDIYNLLAKKNLYNNSDYVRKVEQI